MQFALFARDKYVSRDQDLWPGNRDKGREGGGQADKQTDGVGEKDEERRKKKKENNSVRKH